MFDQNGEWWSNQTSWRQADDESCRLLEYAGLYYDLASFPAGEAKSALQHMVKKNNGKVDYGARQVERTSKKQRQ
jgi:hypothetical protein